MKYYLIFLIVIIFNSCNSIKVNNKLKGRKLAFPLELKAIQEGEISVIKLNDNLIKDSSLVVLVDGDCHSCFNTLKNWEEFIYSSNIDMKFNVYIVAQTSDLFYFSAYIYPYLNVNMKLYIDSEKKISKMNDFLIFKENHVFLIDKNRTIHQNGGLWLEGEIYDYLLSL